jgi:uncharacterized protein (DUF924 family)
MYVEHMVERAPAHLRKICEFFANQARAHREAIVRFGRHPQRNAILMRTSTSEEIDYVKTLPVHLRPRSTDGISE